MDLQAAERRSVQIPLKVESRPALISVPEIPQHSQFLPQNSNDPLFQLIPSEATPTRNLTFHLLPSTLSQCRVCAAVFTKTIIHGIRSAKDHAFNASGLDKRPRNIPLSQCFTLAPLKAHLNHHVDFGSKPLPPVTVHRHTPTTQSAESSACPPPAPSATYTKHIRCFLSVPSSAACC